MLDETATVPLMLKLVGDGAGMGAGGAGAVVVPPLPPPPPQDARKIVRSNAEVTIIFMRGQRSGGQKENIKSIKLQTPS